MTLNRQTLAKIDKRILSQMDHGEGVQLVKVPVSEAVWSTWRRYCEAAGISMGRALAILLHQELASVVDLDLDRIGNMLGEREAVLDERERDLEQREERISLAGQRVGTVGMEPKPPPLELAPAGVVPRDGRNDLCPCGSGLKYKRCHGA